MQPPSIIFPDAEDVVSAVLQAALATRPEAFTDNVYVGKNMPSPNGVKPARLIWVQSDGGPRLDKVRTVARMRLNVMGDDEDDVADLTRLAASLLWACPDGDPILRVDGVSGPVTVPDETYAHRKFFTAEVLLRGIDLPADMTA